MECIAERRGDGDDFDDWCKISGTNTCIFFQVLYFRDSCTRVFLLHNVFFSVGQIAQRVAFIFVF